MQDIYVVPPQIPRQGDVTRRCLLGAAVLGGGAYCVAPGISQLLRTPAPYAAPGYPPLPAATVVARPLSGAAFRSGQAAWAEFERRFMTAEGRVVDTGNGGISHSEGQGVGMLSAALFGERPDFDKLALWTTENLTRAYDPLHSWRYRPGDANPVSDPNNATDGDLLIAYAFFTAADRWGELRYRHRAVAIAQAVLSALVRTVGDRTVLMPAVEGFDKPSALVINPSYYLFPALRRFAAELPDQRWDRLWSDGVALFRSARFGSYGLPADWLSLTRDGRSVVLADAWPARYSFDAVRLPLYMMWAGLQTEPVVDAVDAFWTKNGGASAPAWTDLRTGAMAPYSLNSGMDAIRLLVRGRHGSHAIDLPPVTRASDYYAGALTMLAHAAAWQTDVNAS